MKPHPHPLLFNALKVREAIVLTSLLLGFYQTTSLMNLPEVSLVNTLIKFPWAQTKVFLYRLTISRQR